MLAVQAHTRHLAVIKLIPDCVCPHMNGEDGLDLTPVHASIVGEVLFATATMQMAGRIGGCTALKGLLQWQLL